jgi:effector-binding domain-containing protein
VQIESQGSLGDYDVVMKSAPALPFLSLRASYPQMEHAIAALRDVAIAVRAQIPAASRDNLVVVAHSDFEDENLELEIGVTLSRRINKRIQLPGRGDMTMTEIPAADHLATIVRSGPNYQSHLAFGQLGIWMEANSYRIAGPCREVFLDLPFQVPDQEETALEIQFPVEKAA